MLTIMGHTKGSSSAYDDDETMEDAPPPSADTQLVLHQPNQASSTTTSNDNGAPTILPRPIATAISGVTGLASLNVRVATKIGGWSVYASREATLKSLSVARSAAEQVLILAGRDVGSRTAPDSLGQQEAASVLQSAIHLLHSVISKASFVASTGFYMTEAALNSASGVAIHGLSVMNALFGNTETSKAVAAVISLLSTELNRPSAQGEHVAGYWDLLSGLIGFVLLQRWGRRKTQLDFRDEGGEFTIWDTVIDDRGFRADVVGTRRQEMVILRPGHVQHTHSFVTPGLDGDAHPEATFEALERGMLFESPTNAGAMELSAEDQTRLSDQELRDQIVRQLPSGARAVVTTETFTAKTIKVEIYDADATNIEAPPGTIMVAERLNHDTIDNDQSPRQTVVFRTALQRSSSAEIEPQEKLRLTAPDDEMSDHEDGVMMRDAAEPVPPPKDIPLTTPQATDSSSGPSDNNQQRLSVLRKKESVANQKKSRKPAFNLSTSAEGSSIPRATAARDDKGKASNEKEGKIRKAMKTLSPTSSFAAIRDAPNLLPRRRSDSNKTPTLSRMTTMTTDVAQPRLYPPIQPTISTPSPSPFGSPKHGATPGQIAAGSYFVRERRRDSIVSQTDLYSVHSGGDSRPGSRAASPTFSRTHSRTVNSISHTQSSDFPQSLRSAADGQSTLSHQRTRSFQPSLYSMGSKHSGEAVVLAPRNPIPSKSIYEDSDVVDALIRDGKVAGTFPDQHLVRTIRRFARFATASYGSGFLHVMGLHNVDGNLSKSTDLVTLDVHREHSSFSDHTGLPANTILLSSFYDPQGVQNTTEWSSAPISPLIHFVSLDEKSKAVVLSVRGTLGFEDVLTDMTCDYDDLVWRGTSYKVHKGIHASARRMLGGGGGTSRVMATLKAALEENPDYGLVLCGHSLGGAVAALLAILISEPSPAATEESGGENKNEVGQSFITKTPQKLLADSSSSSNASSHTKQPHQQQPPTNDDYAETPITLPPNRPIHVYSYGTPATVSEPLRLATRGLITTVANASDIVPCLSLGTLHDFRAIAVHLRHDQSDGITELKSRVWNRIRTAFSVSMTAEKSMGGPPPPENIAGEGVGEDTWAWRLLGELRMQMSNEKLVPPGEVFIVEATRVFDRLGADVRQEARYGGGAGEEGGSRQDAANEEVYRALGRPATRVQFKWVKDVKRRFGEVRFGSGMFSDHSPGRYERNLGSLEVGVCEE